MYFEEIVKIKKKKREKLNFQRASEREETKPSEATERSEAHFY